MIYDYPVPDQIEPNENDPRIQAALAELRALILRHFPDTTFIVHRGEEPVVGIYLRPIVDVEDLDEVGELVTPRLVDMQVEEGLPIYVFPRSAHYLGEQMRQMSDQESHRAAS